MNRQILSMMLENLPVNFWTSRFWLIPQNSPGFPRIPQNFPEFPRLWSGKANIVYDVREFAKLASAVVGSNVEYTWLDMFRPVWTSLDLIKIRSKLIELWSEGQLLSNDVRKFCGYYFHAMLKIHDWYFNMTENQTCCIVHTTYLKETMWGLQISLNHAACI